MLLPSELEFTYFINMSSSDDGIWFSRQSSISAYVLYSLLMVGIDWSALFSDRHSTAGSSDELLAELMRARFRVIVVDRGLYWNGTGALSQLSVGRNSWMNTSTWVILQKVY